MDFTYFGLALIGSTVSVTLEAVTLLLLVVSVTVNVLVLHRRVPTVSPASSVLSNPPPSAVYTERSVPPDDAGREVVSAVEVLVLNQQERVELIALMMSRTGIGMELLHSSLAPAHVLELAHAFRREAYDWLAGDDEELRDEWWDCVEGVGRWADPGQALPT